METMKKNNKAYTATCPFLHLQKCISSNSLMENKVCKGQIFRIFASLSPNYGRKSHGYGDISIF